MASYEVHIAKGARWSLESRYGDKTEAISHAKAIFGRGDHDGVKVTDGAGGKQEKVVFLQERQAAAVTIIPQKESPVCEDLESYFGYESRKFIGRLLRKFLDDQGLIPLELVFSYSYLRMLSRTDTLYNQAISAVGSLQARKTGQKPQERNDALYAAYEKVMARARKIGEADRFHAQIREGGFGSLVSSQANEPPARRDYFVRAGLANYLMSVRSWDGKIGLVFEQLDKGLEASAMIHIDEALSEILDSPEAVRDFLGGQPDMAAALTTMLNLARGKLQPRSDAPAILERINTVLARPDLPLSRDVLIERVQRTLEGTTKLSKGGSAEERKAFGDMLKVISTNTGMIGGASMAEAATARARLVLGDTGSLNVATTIDRTVLLLESRAERIGYLVDIAESELGEEHEEVVKTNLERLIGGLGSANDLVDGGAGGAEAARALGGRLASCGRAELEGFGGRLSAL